MVGPAPTPAPDLVPRQGIGGILTSIESGLGLGGGNSESSSNGNGSGSGGGGSSGGGNDSGSNQSSPDSSQSPSSSSQRNDPNSSSDQQGNNSQTSSQGTFSSSSNNPSQSLYTTEQQPSQTQTQSVSSTDNGTNNSASSGNSFSSSSTPTSQSQESTSSSRSRSRSRESTESTPTTIAPSTYTSQYTSDGNVVQVTSTVSGTTSVVVVTQNPNDGTAQSERNNSSHSGSNGGLIGGVVGGVIGGLALLTLLAFVAILWRRRKARTGHGWFLCFGVPPSRSLDGDDGWPTFDPANSSSPFGPSSMAAVGAAGAGAAVGAGSKRKKGSQPQATLPEGFEADPEAGADEVSSGDHEMREHASPHASGAYAISGGYGSHPGSYGAPGSQDALSNGAPGSYGAPSEEGHFARNSQPWGLSPFVAAPGSPPPAATQHAGEDAPDYGHLDPPEVREARAREQAEAAAAYRPQSPGSPGMHPAMLAGGMHSPTSGYSHQRLPSNAGSIGGSRRPSQGTLAGLQQSQHPSHTEAYVDAIDDVDDEPRNVQNVDIVGDVTGRMLHLSNPDN